MKFLTTFSLFEAIKLSDARKVTEIFLKSGGKERYNEVFKGKDRLYYDLQENVENPKTELSLQIESELGNMGYTMIDYYSGLAKKDGDNKNTFKIQKLLVKWGLNDLKSKMDADPIRSGTKVKGKKVVISRHGIDLAGVSTGRGWTSCKKLETGMNSRYVFTEAEVGSLVAYLIDADDLNIQKPIARISIHVYVNTKDPSKILLYPEPRGYGNYSKKDFFNFVLDWVKDFNKHINPSEGTYTLSNKCYSDESRPINYTNKETENIGANIGIFASSHGEHSYVIKYDSSKKTVIEDLYENIEKENVSEDVLTKYVTALDSLFFKGLLADYINREDNKKTEDFIDTNTKKMSILLNGIGEDVYKINPEKTKIIVEKYYKNIPESAKVSILKIKSNKPFFSWFITNLKKSGLIKPDFQNID